MDKYIKMCGMNNFQRALKHKNSSSIDEKIAHLDEMMVTTGMYSVVKQTDGIEEEPPTYGEAPLGDYDPDNFSWPDQGDGSDADANPVTTGLTVTDTLGREISTFDYLPGVTYSGWSREPDYSIYGGKKPLAILYDTRALASTRYLVLYEDGVNQVWQDGFFTTPAPYSAVTQAVADWVRYADKSNITTKTIYIWGGMQVLFGTKFSASQYYPAGSDWDSDPQATRGLYAYTMYVPRTGNTNYATDPGVRTKPPVVSNVISRDNLGDPNYFPGNPLDFLMGLLDLGKQGLDYILTAAEELAQEEPQYPSGSEVAAKLGLISGVGALLVTGAAIANALVKEVDSGSELSVQLAGKLLYSIISGQPQEIVLSDEGKADQINSVDAEEFERILTVGGPAPEPSAESTVSPQNKGQLLTGSWGDQGASEVHYDPENDTLTITSEKMLRTTSGGNTVETDDTGKITSFSDIPEPTDEQVAEITKDLMTGPLDPLMQGLSVVGQVVYGDPNTSNVTGGPLPGESEPQEANTWNEIKSDPNLLNTFSDNMGKAANDLATSTVQGTASNTVALRKAATNLGAPESEVEKTGGGYGQVYSQTEYTGDEIPPELRNSINKKTGVEESYSISEEWQSPKHTGIQKDMKKRFFDPKDIAPEYPKKNPEPMNGGYNSKSTLAPKKLSRDPVIKLTKKDLSRNHRLTKKEVKDMMDTINKINKFLDANPAELIHARIRYPKDDPRLAELNWKLDQQLSASNEYLDKRFPENKQQTARVKKILARNIELTDPRTFKSVKQPVTYEKMFKGEDPNKRIRLKDYSKKSPARFFKTEKKKDTSRLRWLKG